MTKVMGYGPTNAQIMLVGDAPSADEEIEGRPFVGTSGKLLTTLLRESGIRREECYVTNVCRVRPPGNKIEAWITESKKTGITNEWPCKDGRYYAEPIAEGLCELEAEIALIKPRVIVGFGNLPLWALAGQWGVLDWRGSEMHYEPEGKEAIPFVPTIHPASIIRNWPVRSFVATDLKQRVVRRLRTGFVAPVWDFNIAPSLTDIYAFLAECRRLGRAAVDVETSRGQIVCIGIAVSATRAICIPFCTEEGPYWSAENKQAVLAMCKETFTSIDVKVIGQNFNYDDTYFVDNFGIRVKCDFDTLIAQSVLFPGTPRGLGFLSSMYCDWHCYWKDDARDWNNLSDYAGLFTYNCRDVCGTFEIAQQQERALRAANLWPQFEDRMKYSHYVFDMMMRGVIRCPTETKRLEDEIEIACVERAQAVVLAAGRPINLGSPAQVSKLLYTDWACRKPARHGKDPGGTGDEELKQVAKWHPDRAPLLTAILEYRSLSSTRNNLLQAALSPDGKLRSSFMTTGTDTFRLTSGKDNFRRGTNLLNISGNGFTHSGNRVPNFRRAIVPPTGYTVFDCDLERADLQVVVWEADDADLKAKLRSGLDIHLENAKDIYGLREVSSEQREKAKKFVHLTNYVGCARTAAIATGSTVHESDMAQRRWFSAHPGIKRWHREIQAALERNRTVTNKFGYRMVFLDRIETLLPTAVAWIPQSTIAIVASHVHMAMESCGLPIEILLQMYDSVMGIYPTVYEERCLPLMRLATQIEIPYDDPLIIPMGIKTSTVSWGDCQKRKWTS